MNNSPDNGQQIHHMRYKGEKQMVTQLDSAVDYPRWARH